MATAQPSDRPGDPASRRRPLSLREMLVLTALAAVALVLVRQPALEPNERWLLGLSIGGPLVGLAISRVCGRSPWLGGLLAGALAGALLLSMLVGPWMEAVNDVSLRTRNAALASAERAVYLRAAGGTIALACCMVLLTILSFQAAVALITRGENGLLAAVRRHPYRAASMLVAAGIASLVGINLDLIFFSGALARASFISIPEVDDDGASFVVASRWISTPTERLELSRSGKWLAVHVRRRSKPAETRVYQVKPSLQLVDDGDFDPKFFAFNPQHEDRLDYVRVITEGYGFEPDQVRTINLRTKQDSMRAELSVGQQVEDMDCLPHGAIIVDRGRSYAMLEPNGVFYEHFSAPKAVISGEFGQLVEYEQEQVRVTDITTSKVVAHLTEDAIQPIEPRHYWFLSDADQWLTAFSPDGRFAIAQGEIRDLQRNSVRTWRSGNGMAAMKFTSSGLAVCSARWLDPSGYRWLHYVPFGHHARLLLLRSPVLLIDPATGREVARTQPLWSPPDAIAFSHDGSRMAVLNREGVYVYDVPEKFR